MSEEEGNMSQEVTQSRIQKDDSTVFLWAY